MTRLAPLALLCLLSSPVMAQTLGNNSTCFGMGCVPEGQFTAEEDRAICGADESLSVTMVTPYISVTWCCPVNGMCHQPDLRSIAHRLHDLQTFYDRNACLDRAANGVLIDTGKPCKLEPK